MRRAWQKSKTVIVALISACGGSTPSVESGVSACGGSTPGVESGVSACGSTPGVESGAMDDATVELESSVRGQLPLTDASAGSDAPSALDSTVANLLDATTDALDQSAPSDGSASDAAKPDARADSGPKDCIYGFKPSYPFCLAAGVITADVALTMQNTAQGARGDCAIHASGTGARNLYYHFAAPAGRDTQVVATARQAGDFAVVRVLSDCYAEEAESGARGFSDGNATTCISNRNGPAREVIIAVGRYSGGLDNDSFAFDLKVSPLAEGMNCNW
jgi:hypothetical protein